MWRTRLSPGLMLWAAACTADVTPPGAAPRDAAPAADRGVDEDAGPTDLGEAPDRGSFDAREPEDRGFADAAGPEDRGFADAMAALDAAAADMGVACTYPSGAVEPMRLGEVISPYRWAEALDARDQPRSLDLARVYCNTNPNLDFAPYEYLLFASLPAW